jgi:hypothetical protein
VSAQQNRVPCPNCGADNFASTAVCWQCGRPIKPKIGQRYGPDVPPADPYGRRAAAQQSGNTTGPSPTQAAPPSGAPGTRPTIRPPADGVYRPPDTIVRAPSEFPGVYTHAFQAKQQTATRPMGLSIFVILEYIGSAFLGIVAIALLVLGSKLTLTLPIPIPPGFFTAAACVFLVVAAVTAYLAYQLWTGVNWARVVFIVLLALGTLGGIAQVAGVGSSPAAGMAGTPPPSPAGALFGVAVNILFLVILNLKSARDFCSG